MRIALTGGIACGKSLVAKFLNGLGVETIDADDVVHEFLPDPAERRRIAAEVFADPAKRKALEAKLHPLVKERIAAWLSGEAVSSPLQDKVVNSIRSGEDTASPLGFSSTRSGEDTASPLIRLAIIPLLFETRWDRDYDIICCVRSARATQVDRMMTTRGYTREEAEARLAAQMPVEEKAAKSHYVIDNDGSPEELQAKVGGFVEWLKREIVESSNVKRKREVVESSNRANRRKKRQMMRSAEEKLAFKKDLESRTKVFATSVFRCLDALPKCNSTRVIAYQLGKSASSVGANYREANRGESTDDFAHKIGIVLKECAESQYWLEILHDLRPTSQIVQSRLEECTELLRIFQTIDRKMHLRKKN